MNGCVKTKAFVTRQSASIIKGAHHLVASVGGECPIKMASSDESPVFCPFHNA